MKTRTLLLLAWLFTVLSTSSLAFAEAADAHLKARHEALVQLAKGDDKAKLDRAFDEILDYQELAVGSLTSETWATLSDAQKKEFVELLKVLVRKAYTKNIKETLAYNVKFVGVTEKDSRIVVNSVAIHQTDTRKDPISIGYVVRSAAGGTWKITDIVTDDVSLVANYRSQFKKQIEKGGIAALLEKMKAKAEAP